MGKSGHGGTKKKQTVLTLYPSGGTLDAVPALFHNLQQDGRRILAEALDCLRGCVARQGAGRPLLRTATLGRTAAPTSRCSDSYVTTLPRDTE